MRAPHHHPPLTAVVVVVVGGWVDGLVGGGWGVYQRDEEAEQVRGLFTARARGGNATVAFRLPPPAKPKQKRKTFIFTVAK